MSFRLGFHLVQQKTVDLESMDRAVRRQLLLGGSLDTSLLELELVDLATLQKGLPRALDKKAPKQAWLEQPSHEALSFLPQALIEQLQVVPVAMESSTAHVLVADIGPPAEHLPLAYWFHRDVRVYPVPHVVLAHALERLFQIPIPSRLKTLAQRFPCEGWFQAPDSWKALWSNEPAKPAFEADAVEESDGKESTHSRDEQSPVSIGSPPPKGSEQLQFPETAPFVSREESAPKVSVEKRVAKKEPSTSKKKGKTDSDILNRTTLLPEPHRPEQTVKVTQSSARRKAFREEELTKPSQTMPEGLRNLEEPTTKMPTSEFAAPRGRKKRITPTMDPAPTPSVDVAPLPDAPTTVSKQDTEKEPQAPLSRLDLPPVDALRSAFRKPNAPRADDPGLLEEKERPASESAMLSSTKAATVQTPASMRDTITERRSTSSKEKAPRNVPRPSQEGDTSEGLALTEADAVGRRSDIEPFETSLDLSLAVNAVEQRLRQDTEPSPPHAIFELAELFKPELPGPHTVPGLPAFPISLEGKEKDIFPEVTMPDTGWMTLTEEDEQVDIAVQLDEIADLPVLSADTVDTEESVDVKIELDEYLSQWDETLRKPLLNRLAPRSGSLIPHMLPAIPASEQTPSRNRALKDRMERLVELCDAIGEPALLRLLQITEKGNDRQRMQAILLLGEWKPPRAIAPLLQCLLHEKNMQLQRMICNNLRQYKGQDEFDKLLTFLRDNLESDDTQRLQKALFFLGHLRVVEALADVMLLLQHDTQAVRESALEILRLLTLQNFDGTWETWSSWWGEHGQENRKQWILNAMQHPELSVRAQVKEELRLEFGDDFGFVPDSSKEERETVRKLATLWLKQG